MAEYTFSASQIVATGISNVFSSLSAPINEDCERDDGEDLLPRDGAPDLVAREGQYPGSPHWVGVPLMALM